MTRNELKALIKETVEESLYARHNPSGDKDITDMEDMGTWRNPSEAEKLKEDLIGEIDAGNFDKAEAILKQLFNLHN